MEQEIALIDDQMKTELKEVKDKYADLKANVKNKYKEIEKKKKKHERDESKKMRKSIPKSLKILVWDKNIGKEKGIGECDVCDSEIDSKNFECGHIKSVRDGGGTTIDNLLPICSVCNKSMGAQNLHEFKKIYFPKKDVKKDNKIVLDKVASETHVDKFIHQKLRKTDEMNYIIVGGVECKSLGKVAKFMSLDKIYSMYRSWLHETDYEHYDSTKYEGWRNGEDAASEKTELKDKLMKVYGEYTSSPGDFSLGSFGDPMGDFISKKGYGFHNICILTP